MQMKTYHVIGLGALSLCFLLGDIATGNDVKLNVLFIAIDDLRPALGCYGDTLAVTPHLDGLAQRGIRFNRAYCQQAVCSPSRLSLLSGRRPDTIGVWDLNTHFRDRMPDLVTLPQYFKNHGYETRSIGKIYHGSGKPSQDPPSWTRPPLLDHERDGNTRYATAENRALGGLKRAATESADVPDETYVDGLVCEAALTALDEAKRAGTPFFLAVGFRKPHLPFCAPRKYWDLYQRDQIPPPVSNEYPNGAPELGVRTWNELEGYLDIPRDGKLTPEKVQELRHGYYACVSYIDALTGRLLRRLDELALADNTIVCVWGDHGFHLGEQGLWTKGNNYELSTRVPLIFTVPGQKHPGAASDALVELVDVYPTLAELCGLPMPKECEGISMVPLFDAPGRPWKAAALSQYPRSYEGSRHRGSGDIMGYSIRTPDHRYVQWREGQTGRILARELYDHALDPNEMRNLADVISHAERARQLEQLLQRGWQAALPRP